MQTFPEWGILREPATVAATGYSRATIRRLEKEGRFPRRIKMGEGQSGAVGWRAAEVRAWVDARQSGRQWPQATAQSAG
jgi:predicted DNA-binding transcriptional regulator AlpA